MKKLFFISIAFALLISAHLSLAQTKLIVPIPVNGVGQTEVSDPGSYITYIYLFGLSIGGLLGMAIIVYAAIERILSAGNESKIKDANDRITQAAIGLLLLFGAYVILQAINPNLTNLNLPVLERVKAPVIQKSGVDTAGTILNQTQESLKFTEQQLAEAKNTIDKLSLQYNKILQETQLLRDQKRIQQQLLAEAQERQKKGEKEDAVIASIKKQIEYYNNEIIKRDAITKEAFRNWCYAYQPDKKPDCDQSAEKLDIPL